MDKYAQTVALVFMYFMLLFVIVVGAILVLKIIKKEK